MKVHTLLGVAAVASMATVASADVDLVFSGFVAAGANFTLMDANGLSGSLDSADGAFSLDVAGENYTWCDDLTVMIANADLSYLHVQLGGYSDFGATSRFTWPTGADGAAGATGGGHVDMGGIDVSGYYVWLGNGYGSGGDGTWTGVIDLNGSIAYVPAPGALALLALGGLVARRRRA